MMYTLRKEKNPLKSVIYNLRKLHRPEWFQGNGETRQYFEGWYFKNVSAKGDHCWSFIPGVSLVEGDTHAFVQAINGQTGQTFYFRYPAEDFFFSSKGFEVKVGNNRFSQQGFSLDLDDGQNRFTGSLSITSPVGFKATLARPGIMGWYRYVPFMECYHGVVSLDHALQGKLLFNGEELDFSGGRGYIEKDWGSSMPRSWIWMQSNHFDAPGTSFMLSVARIPWIGKTFTGFLGFFLHQGKVIPFATYTGAKINSFEYSERETRITIRGAKHELIIHGMKADHKDDGRKRGSLKAPVLGAMDRVIHESIDATLHVQVKDKSGKLLFDQHGHHAGLEFVGDLELLRL
ncbi:MAG: tocopherol cyclase family protein [Bacteroidales bacterium]